MSLTLFHDCDSLTECFLCYHCRRKRLARELEGQSDVQAAQEERGRVMDGANPRVVLRNYIAQNAIEAAESGDFSEVRLGFTVCVKHIVLLLLAPPRGESIRWFVSGIMQKRLNGFLQNLVVWGDLG